MAFFGGGGGGRNFFGTRQRHTVVLEPARLIGLQLHSLLALFPRLWCGGEPGNEASKSHSVKGVACKTTSSA